MSISLVSFPHRPVFTANQTKKTIEPTPNITRIIYTEQTPAAKREQKWLLGLYGASIGSMFGSVLLLPLQDGLEKSAPKLAEKLPLPALQKGLMLTSLGSFLATFPMAVRLSKKYTKSFCLKNADLEAIKQTGTDIYKPQH